MTSTDLSLLRWHDQTGRTWEVRDMTTTHIKNSMRYMMKRAQYLWDERTVAAFARAVESGLDLEKESHRAMVQHWFDHLQMTPTEFIRRTDIMWAFHHELALRRVLLAMAKGKGRAIFEFPS